MYTQSNFYFLLLRFLYCSCMVCSIWSCQDKHVNATENDKTNYALLMQEDWHAPDFNRLLHEGNDSLIRYGKELIANTGKYFGPAGTISKNANGMNCQNCHLDAGTRIFANTFSAVYANYPKLRARSGQVEDLVKRIHDCFERSLNGQKPDADSREMKAMMAYINWVGKDVPKDSTPEGAAIEDLTYLDRAADSSKGRIAFETHCIKCHNADGQGLKSPDGTFVYPPLWGEHSYTTAAGMYRISRLAGFIHSNMPFQEASHNHPLLSVEDAWDIAAFINCQARPEKTFKEDWPDIKKKPVDHPFGPFADNFTESQHKYGPFDPIKKARQK